MEHMCGNAHGTSFYPAISVTTVIEITGLFGYLFCSGDFDYRGNRNSWIKTRFLNSGNHKKLIFFLKILIFIY